ncbi:Endonuclease/exonuclease/phosphatase [Mucor mucedo]|uniref:Endonuclease/exonuclease/phosphatase n=1 Tax=Mucor mucedo TaxID=29922 RepID=UPI00221FE566|nr:Endonuclease/exonuclease/phosphatase [Mucor mucedo]KAI7873842.1 Endonuclease/exonuclease/phosphatase [Mucor mucedo]
MALVPGYHAYFSFSKVKLGYSGVAVYIKDTFIQPQRTYEGITGILDTGSSFTYNLTTPAEKLDAEGRCIILDFGFLVLFNIYFPNDSEGTRLEFKMDYHVCVKQRVRDFLEMGKEVILVGDINAVHEEIDHCDPKQSIREHGIKNFKDLPQRSWLDQILVPNGPLIDMTRLYHPDRQKMFTCWNTRTNARPANFGTRIDYVLASRGLKSWFKYSDIQPEIMGSDHCPVYADFLDEMVDLLDKQPTTYESPLLSHHYPEFSNKQKKLSNYFSKSTSSSTPTLSVCTPSKRSADDEMSRSCGPKKQKSIQSFFNGNSNKKDDDVDKLIQHVEQKETTTKAWTSLFSAREVPRCKVHNEPCLERTVTKKGPNLGRIFYICSKPIGPKDGPAHQFNCNFFQWKTTK